MMVIERKKALRPPSKDLLTAVLEGSSRQKDEKKSTAKRTDVPACHLPNKGTEDAGGCGL